MDHNKAVLKYCPNFERIINFDYYEDDVVTERLIHIYENYIFKADIELEEEIKTVRELDRVMGRYIDDYAFRKEMQVEIFRVRVKKTCANVLKAIVESIIRIFERYEEGTTRNIYISRWI